MLPPSLPASHSTSQSDIQVRVLANRIRRGTGLSRRQLARIEALRLPRLSTTLSVAVAYGEMGFLPTLPPTGHASAEIAAPSHPASHGGVVARASVTRQYVSPSYVLRGVVFTWQSR